MHLTSFGTLLILITSTGEFLLYFAISFFFSFISLQKKIYFLQDYFYVVLCCLVLAAGVHVPVGLNCDQMEEGEQYSEYSVGRNPSAYISMRDYKSLPWHNQHPVERNPNPSRSMRDYRNPSWMSAPFCNVPPTYAPPASPYYASTPQPPQPPQLSSPVEQAILNLTKLVGDVVEEQKKFNAQLSQKNSYCGELSEPKSRWASK